MTASQIGLADRIYFLHSALFASFSPLAHNSRSRVSLPVIVMAVMAISDRLRPVHQSYATLARAAER